MLYSLGALEIQIAPFNVNSVDRASSADFVWKPIIGAEQPAEFVGEGSNAWTLTGRLLPRKLGGMPELERLHQMRSSGQPQYLMRGDGVPMGWVVIESVSERSSYLDAQGVGQVIDVTINVRRSRGPSAGSFFSSIVGLFQ